MKTLDKFTQGLIAGIVLIVALGAFVGALAYRSYIWRTGEVVSQPQSSALIEKPLPEHPIKGNKDSKIYHWFGCPNYDDISPRNVEQFAAIEDAEAKGYRPARNCSTAPGVPGRRRLPSLKSRAEQQADKRIQQLDQNANLPIQ